MARYLKTGITEAESEAVEAKVRDVVENILTDIKTRGDIAVRELSERFDNWSPESFRLSQPEIEELIASLPEQTIEDMLWSPRLI
jgi:sulfopropanediol 3-dehydrogenase